MNDRQQLEAWGFGYPAERTDEAATKLVQIIETACERYEVVPEVLPEYNRHSLPSAARKEAMAFARFQTDLSLHQLGEVFRRDHASICHAVKTYQTRPTKDNK